VGKNLPQNGLGPQILPQFTVYIPTVDIFDGKHEGNGPRSEVGPGISSGDHHAYLEPGKEEDLTGFERVIYVPTAKEKPMEARWGRVFCVVENHSFKHP